MLTDNQISALQNELIDIYSKMEIELIVSVAKRLSNYDEVSGSLNWELKKLSELNVLSKDLMKIIQKYTSKTNKAVENMLKKAMLGNVDKNYLDEAFKEGLAAINYKSLSKSPTFKRMLNTSIYELNNSLSMINSKAIETAKESYVKVLNKAYAEVATGTYSYSTAIQKSIKEMAKNGIKGATYESGRSIGIEPAIRRDTLSALIHNVNQSTIVTAKEVGTNYVEVSEHLGARVSTKSKIANHAGWQGKVYMIEGSNDEYGNLVEETGYGDIEGLGGVNCRHRMFIYFPNISVKKDSHIDKKRNAEVYKASQQLRVYERDFRSNKKLWYASKEIGDKDTKKKCESKSKKLLEKIKKIENEYPELRSNGNRTLVLEDVKL